MKISIGLGLMLIHSFSFSQSLFESSLSNTHEIDVSNSLSVGGFIRSASYIGNTPEEKNPYLQSCYGQAGLLLNINAGAHASAKAEFRYRYGTEFGEDVNLFELREAYIDLFAGPLNFRIGKQIVSWGKGTIFNPTQRITPLDPLSRSPDPDDMKLGNWALQGGVMLGTKTKLSAYWTPIYAASRLLIEPIPMPDYISFKEQQFPEAELKNGSYGLKYDLFLSGFDASFSWFDGYNHFPGISYQYAMFDTLTFDPLEIALAEKAYRVQALGLDFAIPVASWIMRFEGAWQMTDDFKANEYIPNPELAYTAEIERTGANLTFIAGYYGKYIMDYASPAVDHDLAFDQQMIVELMQSGFLVTPEIIDEQIRGRIDAFNKLYNYQLHELYHSAFVVLKGNFFYDKLELSLPVIYNFTSQEWTLRPGITYRPFDGIHIQAGYEGYYGAKESLYDLVGPVLNSGFLSVKLVF